MKMSGRVWLIAGAGALACGGPDTAIPVATPTVVFETADVSIGSAVDATYRFAVASDAAPFEDDYWVFVHFVDDRQEILWTDDHEPLPPTSMWKAGSRLEYTRTMFIPKLPYTGDVRVEMGLFSRRTGNRLPLVGQSEGMRAYHTATLRMRLDPDQTFVVFGSGWHSAEIGEGGLEWQWSRRAGVLTFRNPKRDSTLFLQLDQAVAALAGPQRVEVRVGPQPVDAFDLFPGPPLVRRIDLAAASLGAADIAEVVVSVDKTFIPANIPALGSTDPRELGVRVYRAHVKPKSSRSGLN